MQTSLTSFIVAGWLLIGGTIAWAQFDDPKTDSFEEPRQPANVDRDPLRPEDWYQEWEVKARARRIDSIDYGAVASSAAVPFWLGEPISRMAFSPDGKLLASGTYSGPIWIWNSETGQVIAKLKGHEKWVSAVVFSPDSKQLISSSGDGTLRIWDINKQQEVKRLDKLRDTPLQMVAHPERVEVFWRDTSGNVWQWKVDAEKEKSVQKRWQRQRTLALAVNSRQLAAGLADGSVYVWDFEREGNFGGGFANSANSMAIAFDSEGHLHASIIEQREGRTQISLYEGVTQRSPVRVQPINQEFSYLSIAPSASVITFANNRGECFLWDGRGKPGGGYLHARWPGGIAFSYDGKRIATCDDSGAIIIRSSETGRRLSPFPLTTYLRPLVQRITKNDPVRVAIHWSYPNQAIPEWRRWPNGDQLAILESIVFHWTGPDNVRQELSLVEPVWRDHNALLRSPTLIMELKQHGLEVINHGPAAMWRSLGEPDFTQVGIHKLSVVGQIRLRGDTDIAFASGETRWEVVERDLLPLRQLPPIAEKKLRAVVDASVAKRISLPAVDWGLYAFVDDKLGNRRIRFGHSTKFGYDQYDVLCAPHGEVIGVYFDHIATCVAKGTTVSTPRGEVPIESLAPGMELWGYDREDRRKLPVKVLAVREHLADFTYQIGGLRVTGEHPILADGKWRLAAELRGGESVVRIDGRGHRIETPKSISEAVTVYEVVVDGPHNYFAGGLLVHNKSRDYSPDIDDPWYSLWPQRRHDHKQLWAPRPDVEESKKQ